MIKRFFPFFIIAIAVCSSILFFRQYVFSGGIPFPANLLVSTYAPWKYAPDPSYPNGPPNKPIGFDNVRQFFPNRAFTYEELKKGNFPLWNPYIFSGTPYFAAFDTGILYPLSFVFQLMPLIDAWSLLVMIQPVLSLCFMYLFLRSLKRSRGASFLASFAYAFSGWMIVYWQESLIVEHSFLWIPLALFASNCIWEKKYGRGLLLLVFSLISSIFAGFLQMTIYVFIVVVLWNMYQCFLHRHEKAVLKTVWILLTGLIGSILISAVQWIPSFEAYMNSPRGTMDGSFLFRDFLAPLTHIITLIAPDFWGNPGTYNYFGGKGFYFEKTIFMGVLPLLFFLYGFVAAKGNNVRFWKVIGVCTFLLGFALPTGWLPFLLKIPILSASYPTRIFAISMTAFIIVASYGIDAFLEKPNDVRMKKILLWLSIATGCLWVFVLGAFFLTTRYTDVVRVCSIPFLNMLCTDINVLSSKDSTHLYATVSLRNLIIPTVFVFFSWITVLSARFSKKMFYCLVFFLCFASSFYFASKYLYFSERRFLYPSVPIVEKLQEISGYDRVWGYGNAFIEKNIPQYFRLFSTDGYGYLSPKRYGELLNTIGTNGTLSSGMRRSDTDLFEASEKEALGTGNPYRLRMMSILSVKYILETKKGLDKDHKTEEDRFPDTLFSLIYDDDTWRIWEFTKALPRVFFVSSYEVNQGQNEIDRLYDPSFDPTKTVLLEEKPEGIFNEEDGKGTVTIKTFAADSVEFNSFSDANGFVVFSDSFYPGWKAFIDNKEVPLYRANYAFRAVPVPKGSHNVMMVYEPVSVKIGIGVTLIGFLFVFGSIVGMIVQRRRI